VFWFRLADFEPFSDHIEMEMVSIGITYRPDIFSHPMQSIEDFLGYMDGEHPAIADMVRSGDVLDTHSYREYLYWAREIYSEDGWFLIGDAARSVDPLYSTGLN
jgi:flavin-dependent dehydrogenase